MPSIEEVVRDLNGRAHVLALLADASATAAWHGEPAECSQPFWHGLNRAMQEFTDFFDRLVHVAPPSVLNQEFAGSEPRTTEDGVSTKPAKGRKRAAKKAGVRR